MPSLNRSLLTALAVTLGLWAGPGVAQGPAGVTAPPSGTSEGVVVTDTAGVRRALDATVPDIRFDETPLEKALETIREHANVNMVVDWSELTDYGLVADMPITLHLRNLPLRVVLSEVLRQARVGDETVGYNVHDGLVRIALADTIRREAGILAEVSLKNTPLTLVIEFLRATDPSFQVLVAGASADELVISELELRDVTAGQVLLALKEVYPQMEVSHTDGNSPSIWTVRVSPRFDMDAELVTCVFRLREAIDELQQVGNVGDRVHARSAVLQLLEHALQMDPSRKQSPAVLQLHEATDTLLFRGTQEERAVLQSAVAALSPRHPSAGVDGRAPATSKAESSPSK